MVKQEPLIQDRYHIIRLLGSGGFAAVYLAQDQRLGRPVALKEMDVARLSSAERAETARLFEHEARMLAQLDHPGLTHVWDYFQENGRAFLVMEYVPGQTLRDLVRRNGPLAEDFVIACGLQLCAVLTYLHSRRPRVIFRDLKPANVMLVEPPPAHPGDPEDETPVLKLIDFGIARFFKPDRTSDTLIIGTPGYAPPEQYGQGQTDERSDIYSLGATLHHLLSGSAPNTVPLPPLTNVSPELARAIARACAVVPDDRHQSAEELRRDLLACAQPAMHVPGVQPPATTSPPASKATIPLPPAPALVPPAPRQTSLLPMALLAVAVVVVALGLAFRNVFSSDTPTELPPAAATAAADPGTSAGTTAWLLTGAPGRIAFGQRSDQNAYDVMVATLDGSAPRRITGDGNNFGLSWSPDGRRLAFARVIVPDRQTEIVVSGDEAGEETTIAIDGYARYPAWSPNGRLLAFGLAPSRAGPFQLAILNLENQQIRTIGPGNVAWISWSSGGSLVYAAPAEPGAPQDIFVLDDIAGGAPRNLTNTPDVEEDFPGWSPDGDRLAFVASPSGRENLDLRQIYTMNADGSRRTQLTDTLGPHTNPVWSPDGRWIAYVSRAEADDFEVWAMRADGGEPRRLSFDAPQNFFLAWGK